MQRVIFTIVIVLWTGTIAVQNRLVPRNTTRVIVEGRVSMLHVAPRFTTTVRLPEPVSSVIVGDPSLFQVEHSPNEPLLVVVKPTTPSVTETNLLITTTGGRQFSILLKSNGETDQSESAVDLFVICRVAGTSFIEETYSSSSVAETLSLVSPAGGPGEEPTPNGGDSIAELLGRQRSRPRPKLQGGRLNVGIGEVIDRGSQFAVLFSVINSTEGPVELMPPQIQLAGQVKSGIFKRSSRWTTNEQIPVIDFRLDQRKLDAGARTDGLVVFERPGLKQSNETLLLQIAEAEMVDRPALVPIRFSVSGNQERKYE